MGETIWLDVPCEDKDAAKAAGARWNPDRRQWFAPRSGMAALQQWQARPELPTLLPGEDRTFGSGLFVDLVPESCWFTNVRSCVDKTDWDRLRRMIYDRADNQCEACGARRDPAAQVRLEAHERWSYDDTTRTQRLRRLVTLCSPCHLATHFGFAQISGKDAQALSQLMTVNNWTRQAANDHVAAAARRWAARSKHDWHLDLTMLTDAGVRLAQPPARFQRRGIAAHTLHTTGEAAPAKFAPGPARPAVPAVSTPAVPPGWHPDPAARFHHRWWNGTAWTEHVLSPAGDQLADPLH